MTYGDTVWCPYGECSKFFKCEIALKRDIEDKAKEQGLPLAVVTERPPCYDDATIITIE